jgi:hypothetical protein
LRCTDVALEPLDSFAKISFWRCPQCARQYAQEPGRALVDRWRGPISLVLYGVIFEERPQEHADRQVEQFVGGSFTPEHLRSIVAEIRSELARPTQPVREILSLRASERDLREYLQLFADKLDAALALQRL